METNDKTVVFASQQQPSDNAPAADATRRLQPSTDAPAAEAKNQQVIEAGSQQFSIKGKTYLVKRNLSENSGEAQVFLVECESSLYVLKLYYPNFRPNEALLKIIWNIQFEMIVNLFDYGRIFINGVERTYELMEHLEGGTIRDITLNNDENRFCRIALAAASALAYCHNNQIIHKDIKPGNFFFRDREQTQLVLGDFGISSLFDEEEGVHRTTQARTPVYAAPEMYDDVIDGEVEITPKVDFYSLGITLLYLWLGRNPFSNNERSMMRFKSEGKLPHLDKLPVYINRLIRGLTCVNPEHRWGYDEVERWFRGEEVELDESSAFLRYKSFMVDPEKNIIAQDVKELAPLLYDNMELGMRYLYGKRITRWLEECGNPKLAVQLDDIVEHRYPMNQKLGLMAALYTMNPDFPYYDIKGHACCSIREVVLSLISNIDDYSMLLRNSDNEFYTYLGVRTSVDPSTIYKNFTTDEPRIAVWKLIYAIDSEMPFLADKPSATIVEIVDSFASGNCSSDEWRSVSDGRLLAWMHSHSDMLAVETVKNAMSEHAGKEALPYIIFYRLLPEVAFDLRKASTPQAVAELMNERLQQCQRKNGSHFVDFMSDYIKLDGRLAIYASIHGWNDVTQELQTIAGDDIRDSSQRLAPYDHRTAAYKLCAALGKQPVYKVGSTHVSCAEELTNASENEIRNELHSGNLKHWLAVNYHEDPFADLSHGEYERRLCSFLEKVGELDSDDADYKRFMRAKEISRSKTERMKRTWNNAVRMESAWKYLFYALAIVLSILVLTFGFTDNFAGHSMITLVIPLGCGTMAVAGSKAYMSGNGFLFSMIAALVGAASALIPMCALDWASGVSPLASRMVGVAIVIVYSSIAVALGTQNSLKRIRSLKKIIYNKYDDEEENDRNALNDYLFYTFKTNSKKFKGGRFALLDDANAEIKMVKNDIMFHYLSWCLLMLLMIVAFVVFHPSLMHIIPPSVNMPAL